MTDLKLPKIPDRTPIRITISIMPGLHDALRDYASIYEKAYGREEPVAELIPAILAAFLENDRAFVRARDALKRESRG
ncbi:hypothetical protein CP98_00564 [Sphingobium yanoikuyae]|uniref:DUF2274 domain-containing protein n=1 Tax=Sphingobium yanoikuyae TaxID=13690 RepID=A0A084ET23_SPHYA|nr:MULTISPECIES: DUF2274 domain-containing protein [Sphingobium]KEZ21115.1 hypothetical protein CP98_00564 [Sphingobium yanoikuyae]PZU63759.1 MAG: DUF2274 domain-containing protein [Sphingobium sp.]